jgi:Immunity protein 22
MNRLITVWLGKAENKRRYTSFLKEQYRDDSKPISEFAASQGETFYDHDFVESEFNAKWKTLDDALLALSHSASYAAELRAKVEAFGYNFTLATLREDFAEPRSYESDGLKLDYLGSFEYDPSAKPEGTPEFDNAVYIHVLDGLTFEFEGAATSCIKVAELGLMIGRVNPYARCLDISSSVPNVDDNQVRISLNSEGLWEIRDFGNNGLTKMSGEDFDNAKWMPFPGVKFSIGEVTFLWSDQP